MELLLNLTDFEAKARSLGAAESQVPYALSRALNDAAKVARVVLTETTWPTSVNAVNKSFIKAALVTNFSRKDNLRVEIFDRLGRASLWRHNYGGTKLPKGSNLAIPVKGKFSRGTWGIPKAQRPRALIAATPKRALRITPKGIFIGQGGRLVLQYSFKPMAVQPADVPFERDFTEAMRRAVEASFPERMALAMRTAR